MFDDLTDKERSYDYDMAMKTLQTLVALGYQISAEELADSSQVRYLELSQERYRQPNGYMPRPLDLGAVGLPSNLGDLVEKLAENTHNIWASGRIQEGWTYGKATVSCVCVCACACVCACICLHSIWPPGKLLSHH